MSCATQVPSRLLPLFSPRGLSPAMVRLSRTIRLTLQLTSLTVLQPRMMRCHTCGLGSAAFARHYLRYHFCFLFLRVMRCFSSPGSPPTWSDTFPLERWVAPFGYPRFNGYLPLHAAFRSLSRPSSPPRAKASFMCPSLAFLFLLKQSLLALPPVRCCGCSFVSVLFDGIYQLPDICCASSMSMYSFLCGE